VKRDREKRGEQSEERKGNKSSPGLSNTSITDQQDFEDVI
jgi:hypothetical protein